MSLSNEQDKTEKLATVIDDLKYSTVCVVCLAIEAGAAKEIIKELDVACAHLLKAHILIGGTYM